MATSESIEFKTVEEGKMTEAKKSNLMIPVIIAIVLGIGTGLFLTKLKGGGSINGSPKIIDTDKIIGSTAKNFNQEAEGILQKNDGELVKEATHILTRGDVSQTIYLTSSVVDLDKYVGSKIKIWGETQRVKNAGWFMDVGKIEILQ